MSTPNPTLPVVTNPTPAATFTDPVADVNGNPIPAGEITGYNVGIRDLEAAGSVAGTYPNTAAVTGASSTSEALALLFSSGALVSGHSYAVAAQTLTNPSTLNSAWSAEYQFTFAPVVPPAQVLPPSGLTVG